MPTITYNIPAGQANDVLAALREKYGLPNATAVQLNDILAGEVKKLIRDAYRDYMRKKTSFDVVLD
jgi:hypothetical protein